MHCELGARLNNMIGQAIVAQHLRELRFSPLPRSSEKVVVVLPGLPPSPPAILRLMTTQDKKRKNFSYEKEQETTKLVDCATHTECKKSL